MRSLIWVLFAVMIVNASPAAQEPAVTYTYEYKGENFEVRVLPDSACCIEVAYKNLIGYLGVQPDGTTGTPYRYTLDPGAVTEEGVIFGSARGVPGGEDPQSRRCHHEQPERTF